MGKLFTRTLHLLGRGLYAAGLAGLVRRLGRRNVKVLLYHDCAPSEDAFTAGLDCTVTPEMFARHLDWVRRSYHVVPLADVAAGTAPPGSAAITFDDGYRSVYQHAFPALAARSLPATVYLISDVIGNGRLVWVNELNWFLRRHPEIARRHIAGVAGAMPDAPADAIVSAARTGFDGPAIEAAIAAMAAEADVDRRVLAHEARLYVDWPEVHEMAGRGISFGNHTCSHPNLERLSLDEQFREIAGCQQALGAQLGEVGSLAYPFGHHSAETAAVAERAGIRSIGLVGGRNDLVRPLAIGRAHVSMGDEADLFAQVEVVQPIKAWLRRMARR